MATWKMDLETMRDFIPYLAGQCNGLSQLQLDVDNEYNAVQSSWADRMCLSTGEQLKITANSIMSFHEFACDAIKNLLYNCNNRAEYIEAPEIPAPAIASFEITIREDVGMNNQNINTDSAALRAFADAMNDYIDGIVAAVNSICNEYDAMHSTWNDELYRRFGQVLEQFRNNMQVQVGNLSQIEEWLRRKIAKLEREER